MTATSWVVINYSVVVGVQVLFAVYALLYTRLLARRSARETAVVETGDVQGFITAKHSQSCWRIAWSFFAGSIGAWCTTTPPAYSTTAGWIGMTSYALSSGIPVLGIAFFGQVVQEKFPSASSLGDFIATRYGPTARLLVVLVVFLNMTVFMLAEFTTIGSLFEDFVGTLKFPVIIVVCVLTTIYTVYGGLLASIATDVVQGVFSLLLLLFVCLYLAVTFRRPLPADFGEHRDRLGVNESGYSSLLAMPISLTAATVFNEGMWQRVWAAESKQALHIGGVLGSVGVVVTVFLYGFFGFLAAWGGLVDFETTNPNLYLFQVFNRRPEEGAARADNVISLVVLVMAATMNESAIDSLQNGMTATVVSQFLRHRGIFWARVCVVVISASVGGLALLDLRVLEVFLIANMLGACWFLPVVIGGFWSGPKGREVVTETPFVLSGSCAMLSLTAYGVAKVWTTEGVTGWKAIQEGASLAWYKNPYLWDFFFVASTSSVVFLFFFSACAYVFRLMGVRAVGLHCLLCNIPGYKALTGDLPETGGPQEPSLVSVAPSDGGTPIRESTSSKALQEGGQSVAPPAAGVSLLDREGLVGGLQDREEEPEEAATATEGGVSSEVPFSPQGVDLQGRDGSGDVMDETDVVEKRDSQHEEVNRDKKTTKEKT
uniref:Sodium/solute symporter n=1 Tax=Chromera velia CCMP2878 TaxID=1169474 RepID=A0A0G4FXD4_9ALVE|mmetsp:Transcript_12375/g.23998  ORF Transcript_12375/g.23998 Transcript_12375/m.23998 type:complete len:658 (+) Transcript_12375:278-2251(+)|eukprot:Cvel_3841.t1-p1 / transcript=Cvel_3841.t1 / gene=Cvel_3841 / organism=Chromera_velia_CCMP2878 / gene_product=hypothetical protein / transcript_product=hypothetical protein / location=Cvel_scaffold162:86465-89778(+) / protein_length=657 / sequence_SO=supercontig / SO=protein_coding / is_pseudo=false